MNTIPQLDTNFQFHMQIYSILKKNDPQKMSQNAQSLKYYIMGSNLFAPENHKIRKNQVCFVCMDANNNNSRRSSSWNTLFSLLLCFWANYFYFAFAFFCNLGLILSRRRKLVPLQSRKIVQLGSQNH